MYRLSAFPKNNEGGNMAGVCLNADHLTTKDMLKIAKDIGYSETAFVFDSKVADFKLRFFTPLKEVDLCGHATIATFNLLKQMDIVRQGTYIQETKAGVLKIKIQKDKVFMEQPPPIYSEVIDKAEVADLFLNNSFVDDNFPIVILSTGLREIFIPIVSKEDMDNLVPNFDKIIEISEKYNCIGVHVFSLDNEVDAYCRNFAPLVGIDEESATGTSSGALGCYLNKYKDKFKTKYIFRQGYTMGKPSEIEVELTLDNDVIRKVYVGGKAIQINE
ncbi:PhzF family phenazine biosynthesis protein [Candidatus Izimoplasma sp. ZiA1]|uniref:PhzF family phenazine biosynthesis protein n=1 Tax=Candidatus Izimoplasma sp. ZiA1 TaxID=2024899 RepID=UPI003F5A4479